MDSGASALLCLPVSSGVDRIARLPCARLFTAPSLALHASFFVSNEGEWLCRDFSVLAAVGQVRHGSVCHRAREGRRLSFSKQFFALVLCVLLCPNFLGCQVRLLLLMGARWLG